MTKQYGIIYKFTIVAKLKMDGQRPFYIGQHITSSSPEEFLSRNHPYYGSGSIWGDFLEKLRELNPNNWRCFIKREILFSSNKVTQRGLDAMEAYYIKREKSHYSFRIGGCNVLWSAIIVGSGNPAKDQIVRDKMRKSKIRLFNSSRGNELRKIISDRAKRKYQKENNPTYGTKWITNGVECKRIKLGKDIIPKGWYFGNLYVKGKNNPMYGKPKSTEQIEKFKKKMKGKMVGKNNPMYGKPSPFRGKTHSEEVRRIISIKVKKQMKGRESPMKGKHHTEESKERMRKAAFLREERKRLK